MARLHGYERPPTEVEVGADGPASAPLTGAAAAAPLAGAYVTYLAMCATIALSGASMSSSQKSKYRRVVLAYVVAVMGAHAADRRARVLMSSTSDPTVLTMYGFIVSIHGLVFATTYTLYFGFVLLGC
jgi:hypothetical protein